MRDDAAPGPMTQASAPKAPGRLGRDDARSFGGWTLLMTVPGKSPRDIDHFVRGEAESVEVLVVAAVEV